MHGGSGADTLNGGDGDDLLHGGTGNDILYGNADDDTLIGGDGQDHLYGGTGADTFVFDATAFNNVDEIHDFSAGDGDRIDLHAIPDAPFDPVQDAISDFVHFTNSGGNSIMSIDIDGAGTAHNFVNVALLDGVTNLDAETLYTNGNLLAARFPVSRARSCHLHEEGGGARSLPPP